FRARRKYVNFGAVLAARGRCNDASAADLRASRRRCFSAPEPGLAAAEYCAIPIRSIHLSIQPRWRPQTRLPPMDFSRSNTMSITAADIEKIARLARIRVDADEVPELTQGLDNILQMADRLQA